MSTALIHGIILAFGLIVPLGAQNMFLFTQGATQTKLSACLPVVLVAGFCDTLLITLAVGGVSLAVLSLVWLKSILIITGVFFLGYIGWLTWHSKEATAGVDLNTVVWPLKRRIVFTLSVSLLNPHAILDTIGVLGTSSLAYTGNDKWAFAFACIVVSWFWFVFLTGLGRIIRRQDGSKKMLLIFNRFSACIMWLSAAYLLATNMG